MKKKILAFIAIPILILCGCEREDTREYTTITDPSVLIGTWQHELNPKWQITFTEDCWYSTNTFENLMIFDSVYSPFCATYTLVNDSLLDFDYSIEGRMVPCDSIPLVGCSGNGTEYRIKYNGEKLLIYSLPFDEMFEKDFAHLFVKSK